MHMMSLKRATDDEDHIAPPSKKQRAALEPPEPFSLGDWMELYDKIKTTRNYVYLRSEDSRPSKINALVSQKKWTESEPDIETFSDHINDSEYGWCLNHNMDLHLGCLFLLQILLKWIIWRCRHESIRT